MGSHQRGLSPNAPGRHAPAGYWSRAFSAQQGGGVAADDLGIRRRTPALSGMYTAAVRSRPQGSADSTAASGPRQPSPALMTSCSGTSRDARSTSTRRSTTRGTRRISSSTSRTASRRDSASAPAVGSGSSPGSPTRRTLPLRATRIFPSIWRGHDEVGRHDHQRVRGGLSRDWRTSGVPGRTSGLTHAVVR